MGVPKIGLSVLEKFAVSIATLLFTACTSYPFGSSVVFGTPQILAQTPNPRKTEADRLHDLGEEQLNISQFEAALQSFQQALVIYRDIKDRENELAALGNLGIVYNGLGNYNKAIESLQQVLKIAREIEDRKSEGKTLGNLGNAYDSLGDYSKAIEYHKQQLAIAREIEDRQGECSALGGLGNAYLSLGDYPKTINYHQESLAIAREIKNRKDESAALGNLGITYDSLGDYSKAVEYYKQQLVIARENKYRQDEGAALGNLGLAYFRIGDYLKAIDYSKQHLAIAREIKDRQDEGGALGNLGLAYFRIGDYLEAIDYYEQHLAIAREIKVRQGEGTAMGNLGITYGMMGEHSKAIEYFKQHLAIAREIKDRQGEGIALNNLGYEFYKKGNLTLAESTLFEGIDILENLRRGLKDSEKISIFETQSRTYRTLQKVLIAQNRSDAALEIAERGRARAFVELLASRSSPNPQQQSPPPPTIEEIKQIAKIQNAILVQYSIYNDFKVINESQTKESELFIWIIKPTGDIAFRSFDLTRLQQQNTSLKKLATDTLASIRKNTNAVSPTRGNNQFKKGDRVKLKNDRSKDPAWIVVAVNTNTLTLRQPSYALGQTSDYPITDVVEKVGANGFQSNANAKNRNLQQLYQLLIEPIAKLLPIESDARVIFIPQQELFAVPFPALQDPQGRYLIEKHTILTAPSIQVLQLTHQQRQRVPGSVKDVLLIGNPIMPKVANKPGEQPQQLRQLKGTEAEVKAIAPLFQTKPIIGKNATKLAILPILPEARIIHFATHGILDDLRGLGSAIALAPSGKDNGLLTAEEIFDLKLNAELVVVSACNTGQGRITGDGVIGLSRSLMNAGVPSIVVSLWEVPDTSTTTLMMEFYRNLQQEKLDKAQSLQKAMQTMIQKDFSPYDWAAFTLIGNAE